MKKIKLNVLIAILLLCGTVMLLNREVSYRQGINFKVSVIKIPLYLKVLDFFDRHYNYKNLVWKIIKSSDSAEERVLKIFRWTHDNIRRVPDGYPVIDDHVWHVIVRGYGADDQMSDVFTTLCNYAGVDAFFDFIYAKDKARIIPFAFVKLDNRWKVFYPAGGTYFADTALRPASLEQIRNKEAVVYDGIKNQRSDISYTEYVENMPFIGDMGLRRANIQSPLNRLIFELKKRCGLIHPVTSESRPLERREHAALSVPP